MSLFRSSVRPPAVVSDEAVARYLAALRGEIDPDPAFRRRLRGVVVNQFVAARERRVMPGMADRLAPARAMGRLGRAVLYASFALGVSVTGVMAASEVAVPGDVLYPLKRGIEDARVQVLPEQFRDALLTYEVGERIAELATLVERGDDARAAALAVEITTEYDDVIAASAGESGGAAPGGVLASLIHELPEQAQGAVSAALDAAAHPGDPSASAGGPGENPGAGASGNGNAGGAGNGNGGPGNGGPGDGPTNGSANGAGNGNGGAGNGNGNGNGPGSSSGRGVPGSGRSTPAPSPEPEPVPSADETEASASSSATPRPTPKAKNSPKP